ncbi:DUF6893 family small protein [Nocardia aurea]
METVGVIALALVAAGAVFGVLLGVRSIPDVKRYMKIRRM